MAIIELAGQRLSWRESGTSGGAAVVFAHGHGLDQRLWDEVIAALPSHYHLISYDLRGHGDSAGGAGSMGALVRDAEQLLDALNLRDVVFVGHGLGGMVAQGLAVKRLDQVRAMVLINSSMKLGHAGHWAKTIDAVRTGGMAAIGRDLHAKWFARANRATDLGRIWAERLMAQDPEGYIEAAKAISGTDFYTPTAGLTLPTLVLAGYDDGVVPPDLVRETAGLIKGADFTLMRRVGHLSPVEAPQELADHVTAFLTRIGHAEGQWAPRDPLVPQGCDEDCEGDCDSCQPEPAPHMHPHVHGAGCGCGGH